MEQPPDNPDDWSDEEWMAWLHATDPEVVGTPEHRVYAPRLDSPTGVILGAAMMGLQKGIYGDVEKPEIVVEADAKGRDDGTKIDLDPDDPAHSTVVINEPPHH